MQSHGKENAKGEGNDEGKGKVSGHGRKRSSGYRDVGEEDEEYFISSIIPTSYPPSTPTSTPRHEDVLLHQPTKKKNITSSSPSSLISPFTPSNVHKKDEEIIDLSDPDPVLPVKKEVSFIPHHNVITKAGKSHFSRVSDAIAEYIDNSLQATAYTEVPERDIKLLLSLNYHGVNETSYFVIADNGVGMDEQKIVQFATYSFGMEARGEVATADNLNISRYGVGAKQAGFFLGDMIHVITKAQDHEFLELTLDEETFDKSYEEKQNAFSSILFSRKQSYSHGNKQYPHEVREFINEYEGEHKDSHFTIMIVRLRKNITMDLQHEKHVCLFKELTRIYHFHLHPEHLPNALISTLRSRRANSKSAGGLEKVDDLVFDSRALLIRLATFENHKEMHNENLTDYEDDSISSVMKVVDDVFLFEIQVPDPNATTGNSSKYNDGNRSVSKLARREDSLWTSELTGDAGARHKIRGMILYNSNCELISEKDVNICSGELSICWQRRMVPQSKVSNLNFYPSYKNKLQLERRGLKSNWKNKIFGFLFFDGTFSHISNNKLKLTLPDLNSWINQKEIITKPKSIEDNFTSWLSNCYSLFDKEYFFEKCFKTSESEVAFKQMTYKNGKMEYILKSGDEIKILLTPKGKMSSSNKSGQVALIKINRFIPVSSLDDVVKDRSYTDECKLVYTRLPEKCFGAIEYQIPLAAIDFLSNYKVSKSDLADQEKVLPQDFVIMVHQSNTDPGEILGDMFVISTDDVLTTLTVQVVDSLGKVVHNCLGDISKPTKVRLKWSDNIDIVNDHCYCKEVGEDGIMKLATDGNKENKVFVFQKLSYSQPGSHVVIIEAMFGEASICQRKINVQVKPANASKFNAVLNSNKVRLGMCLPEMELSFLDARSNPAFPVGEMTVSLTSATLGIQCLPLNENSTFRVNKDKCKVESLSNILKIPNETWKLSAVNDNVMAPSQPLTFNVSVSGIDYQCPVAIEVKSGPPSSLKIDPSLSSALSISEDLIVGAENYEYLRDNITLCLLDAQGNRFEPDDFELVDLYLEIGAGPLSIDTNDITRLTPNGTISINNGFIDLGRTVNAHCVKVDQELILRSRKFDHWCIESKLTFSVFPGNFPMSIEVYLNGVSFPESTIFEPGDTITKLSILIMNECSQPWRDSPNDFIEVIDNWTAAKSESVKRKKKQTNKQSAIIDSILELPDLQLPSLITENPIQYGVDIVINNTIKLECSFHVSVSQLMPCFWGFENKVAKGLRKICCNDCDALVSSIGGVIAMDKFDNKVMSYDYPIPTLRVSWFDPDLEGSTVDHSDIIPESSARNDFSNQITLSRGMNYSYLPDENMCIKKENNIILPKRAWLIVSDLENQLETWKEEIEVVAGAPSQILLQLGDSEKTNHLYIPTVHEHLILDDLDIVVCDANMNTTNTSKLKGVSIKITTSCGVIVYTEKAFKGSSLTKKIDFSTVKALAPHLFENQEIFQLIVSGRYQSGNNIVELQSSTIYCTVKILNTVTSISASLLKNGQFTSNKIVSCGEDFGITVKLMTSDGKVFVPSEENFRISCKSSKLSREEQCETEIRGYDYDINSVDGSLSISAKMLRRPGKYTYSLTFLECRPQYVEILPEKFLRVSAKLEIECRPGLPSQVQLAYDMEYLIFEHFSNGDYQSSNVELIAVDLFGNVSDTDDQTPCCEILYAGCLVCKISGHIKSKDTYIFDELKVSDLQGDSDIECKFFLENKVTGSRSEEVSIPGKLMREQSRKDTINQPAVQKSVKSTVRKIELTSRLHECRQDIGSTLKRHKILENMLTQSQREECNDYIVEHLEKLKEAGELEMQDRKDAVNKMTKAKKIPLAFKLPDEALGQVVSLGYGSTHVIRFILSWAAMDYMSAIVVKRSRNWEGFPENVKIWPLDQLPIIYLKKRSVEEKKKQQLSLEIEWKLNKSLPLGNPKLLVNLIQLDQDNEDLRESIFYSIFENSLLFDDNISAKAYRDWFLQHGRGSMPDIFTKEGVKFDRRGIIWRRNVDDPTELQYIFGEQNPVDSSEFRNLKRELDDIVCLLEKFEEIKQINEELSQL